MDRAQELYQSMLLRGYHQHFHYAPVKAFRGIDAAYMIAGISLVMLFRFVNITQLLGGLVTG
jgi:cobalt/nickel transport system permease protein